ALFLEPLEERVCLSTVAYWRVEESVPNSPAQGRNSILGSSGHLFYGKPVNGPLFPPRAQDNALPPNRHPHYLSLQFNAVNQRVFIPDNPLFQLTKSLTIEAYIKRTGAQTALLGSIFFRGDKLYLLDPYYLSITGNNLTFHIENAAGQQANIS